MKQLGKASLKKHYAIFVMACLIAAFLVSPAGPCGPAISRFSPQTASTLLAPSKSFAKPEMEVMAARSS